MDIYYLLFSWMACRWATFFPRRMESFTVSSSLSQRGGNIYFVNGKEINNPPVVLSSLPIIIMIAWHVQLMMTSCENECFKEKRKKKLMACWLVGVLLLEAEEAAGLYGKVLLGHEAADKGANGENSIRHKFHSMTIQ